MYQWSGTDQNTGTVGLHGPAARDRSDAEAGEAVAVVDLHLELMVEEILIVVARPPPALG